MLFRSGDNPLVTVGKDTFLDDALSLLGATNIYSDAVVHYPTPALEDVVTKNPDQIIVLALGKEMALFEKMGAAWARFPTLAAVKANRVHVVKNDALLRPTLRLIEGLKSLESIIYGSK